MSRVTTGASFSVLGVCDAVTTMGFSSTESRKVDCAERLTAGRAIKRVNREFKEFLDKPSGKAERRTLPEPFDFFMDFGAN
jgi:hypothetical protein